MAADTVQEIKNKLSIQEVVAPYVKLHRAGRSTVGLCPFHKEKTPSFHVSPERGTYHCFGCGEGGDMFSFIEKVEGVDFKGALALLAEKAGVPLDYSPGRQERSDKRERLYDLLARAAAWYAGNLERGSAGYEYALRRGLSPATILEWGIGYAPDAWRALLEAQTAAGFTSKELLSAGLIKEADGKRGTYYDRFRNRLLFPIRDSAGRVVAFTGRALPAEAPAREGAVEPAKYLNSPETDLYHKSDILFGFDRAKNAARTRGFMLLVEGQMDLLHAHQAGFTNTVALSGTALTPTHVRLMKRASDNLMLVLDADNAGLAASAHAAGLALAEGFRVKAARLPEGEDPADVIQRDAGDFAERIKNAEPIIEFFVATYASRERDAGRLVRVVERVVLPLIPAMKSPLERDRAVQTTARLLGLSPEAVREAVLQVKRDASPQTETRERAREVGKLSARETRERLLIAAIHVYAGLPLADRVKMEYARITGDTPIPAEAPPESALFEAERQFGEAPAEGAADDLLRAFEEAVVREAYQEAVRALRQAEALGNTAEEQEAALRCARLSARLAALEA